MFVLDSSGSIRSANPADGSVDNWNLMLEFVIDIITRLDISEFGVHVGLVVYSGLSKIEFLLDKYYDKNDLVEAIRQVQYIGTTTNTAAGILDMRVKVFDPNNANARGDRVNVPNIAVVITDGESNVNEARTVPNADAATADGITMLAVGITDQVNMQELAGISSTGIQGDTYWTSPSFMVTSAVVQNIVNRTCVSAGGGMIFQAVN